MNHIQASFQIPFLLNKAEEGKNDEKCFQLNIVEKN